VFLLISTFSIQHRAPIQIATARNMNSNTFCRARQSICEIEVDVAAKDIVNPQNTKDLLLKFEKLGNTRYLPSLAAIWKVIVIRNSYNRSDYRQA
jgi:hypothetical protein